MFRARAPSAAVNDCSLRRGLRSFDVVQKKGPTRRVFIRK